MKPRLNRRPNHAHALKTALAAYPCGRISPVTICGFICPFLLKPIHHLLGLFIAIALVTVRPVLPLWHAFASDWTVLFVQAANFPELNRAGSVTEDLSTRLEGGRHVQVPTHAKIHYHLQA